MSTIKRELSYKLIQKAFWILFSLMDRKFFKKLPLLLQLYLFLDIRKNNKGEAILDKEDGSSLPKCSDSAGDLVRSPLLIHIYN